MTTMRGTRKIRKVSASIKPPRRHIAMATNTEYSVIPAIYTLFGMPCGARCTSDSGRSLDLDTLPYPRRSVFSAHHAFTGSCGLMVCLETIRPTGHTASTIAGANMSTAR